MKYINIAGNNQTFSINMIFSETHGIFSKNMQAFV
jgi:hypothetical protein